MLYNRYFDKYILKSRFCRELFIIQILNDINISYQHLMSNWSINITLLYKLCWRHNTKHLEFVMQISGSPLYGPYDINDCVCQFCFGNNYLSADAIWNDLFLGFEVLFMNNSDSLNVNVGRNIIHMTNNSTLYQTMFDKLG